MASGKCPVCTWEEQAFCRWRVGWSECLVGLGHLSAIPRLTFVWWLCYFFVLSAIKRRILKYPAIIELFLFKFWQFLLHFVLEALFIVCVVAIPTCWNDSLVSV